MPDTKIILCDMKFNPCNIRLNNKLRKLGGGRDQGLEWRMGEGSEVVGWWEVAGTRGCSGGWVWGRRW